MLTVQLMTKTYMEGLHFTWPASKYSYCDICYHIYTVLMPSTFVIFTTPCTLCFM